MEHEEYNESEQEEVAKPRMRYEISSSMGSYWNNFSGAMMEAEKKVYNMMNDYCTMTVSAATPQYGFAKGISLFGKEGIEATYKELKNNLLDRDCVRMLYPHEVTAEIKDKALHYLMFLKRKRFGNVKDRGVVDGRKQKSYVTKEESSSPTVSLNALMATCIMGAMEGRKITTVNIPEAFSQA